MGTSFSVTNSNYTLDDLINIKDFSLLNNSKEEIHKSSYKSPNQDKCKYLKVWKIFEYENFNKKQNKISSENFLLENSQELYLKPEYSYIILITSLHRNKEEEDETSNICDLNLNSENLVKNMTKRGLEYLFSSDFYDNLDSNSSGRSNKKYKYQINLWNGSECSEKIKSSALIYAHKLSKLLNQYETNIKFFCDSLNSKNFILPVINGDKSDDREDKDESKKKKKKEKEKFKLFKTTFLVNSKSSSNESYGSKKEYYQMFENFSGKEPIIKVPKKSSGRSKKKSNIESEIYENDDADYEDLDDLENDLYIENEEKQPKQVEEKSTTAISSNFSLNIGNIDKSPGFGKLNFDNIQKNNTKSNKLGNEPESMFTFNANKLDINDQPKEINYSNNMTMSPGIANNSSGSFNFKKGITFTPNTSSTVFENSNTNESSSKAVTLTKIKMTNILIPVNNNEMNILKQDDRDEEDKICLKEFSLVCSEILDNFLFLSGRDVAENLKILKENKITHVINSAADVVESKFENIKYLNFNLRDISNENIECCFYETFDFIEQCAQEKGRVLVHCVQGISRSTTLVISYVMLKKGLTYDEVFNFVQLKRQIANPNLGFILQANLFYTRVFQGFNSLKNYPKLFSIGYISSTSNKVVCRFVYFLFR